MKRWLGILAGFAVSMTAAGGALAASAGNLDGQVNATTSQHGGKITPTFDVTHSHFYNASGAWRCTGTHAKTGLFQFFTNGLTGRQQSPFRFNRAFTFKLRQRWYASGQNPFKPLHYQPGKVSVTITGTIKKLSDPHGPRKPGKVSGRGTVSFSAPGCSSGKLSWSGTGQLTYF